MLQWLSWSSFLHKRSLAAVGTILTILIACSCFLPMRHGVIGAAQTRLSSESSADLWPISIDYPENGSIFPPGITPPTFIWRDAAASSWQIEIVFADKSAPMHFQPKAERMHLGAIDPECISNTNELPKLTHGRGLRTRPPGRTFKRTPRSRPPHSRLPVPARRAARFLGQAFHLPPLPIR